MKKTLTRTVVYMSVYTIFGLIISTISASVIMAEDISAQSIKEVEIVAEFQEATLVDAFEEIEKKTDFKFLFNNSSLQSSLKRVTIERKEASVESFLLEMGRQTGVAFRQVNNTIAVSLKEDASIKGSDRAPGSITGEVRDASTGEPLPAANVFIKETTTGVATDADGKYTLTGIEEGAYTMVSTFVGFQSLEKPVTIAPGDTVTVDFELHPTAAALDELVVIGYGSVNRRDLTGSVSTMESQEIEDLAPSINIDQALQGKAAGVYIVQDSGQPGSAAKIRIRGSTSLLGSNQPLFVIDGIPISTESNIPDDGSTFNSQLLQQGLNSPLGNINPSDIESISVLKDASAAAIYGSRAANGVIMITTKRGSATGGTQFNASYATSVQEAVTSEVLNAEQFRQMYTEAVENSEVDNAFTQSVMDGSYFGDTDTDWEEEVSRKNSVSHNFNLSASGGTEDIRYYSSVGVRNQPGIFKNSSFDRFSANLNLDTRLTERLDVRTKLNYSFSNQLSPDGGLLARIYDYRPDIPVFDEEGNYAHSGTYSLENPVALSEASIENKTTQFLGSALGEFTITEDLFLKSVVKLTVIEGALQGVYPSTTFTGGWRSGNPGPGFAKEGSTTSLTHEWENTLTYQTVFNEAHDVTGVIGALWEGNSYEYLQASGRGFPKDEILTNLSSASQDFIIASNERRSGLASYFARGDYNYDSRYLLTLSGRMDGSSKFAEDNQWAFFPAVAVAWRISNEDFFSGVNFVDELKVKASAGETGQQDFSPYQWRTLFESTEYGGKSGVVKSQLGNSELQWEVTRQYDLGLDFILFSNRLSGSLGYYQKNTEDLLYFFRAPGNTGFSSVITNLGDTQNRGYEMELEGILVQSNAFQWNLSVNVNRNTNKLVKLNDHFLDEELGFIFPPNTGSVLQVGKPLGLMNGYVSEGIFQTQEEIDELNAGAPDGLYQRSGTSPGDLKFRDVNGDGEITSADRTIIGDSQPDFTGGFTNTFSYKGFRLITLFTFSVGNDLRWGYQASGINFGSTFMSENKSVEVLNRWTPQNPTNQPRAVYLDPNDNDRVSSYYVHDASYLRLKNLKLSYNLPNRLLSGYFNSVSVYAIAKNLLTFTGYPGADPETNNLFDDDVSSGLDNSRYPTPRELTVGIKVKF